MVTCVQNENTVIEETFGTASVDAKTNVPHINCHGNTEKLPVNVRLTYSLIGM